MLFHGCCLDVLPALPKVNLVLADMPYGTTQCTWDSPIDLGKLWSALEFVRHKNTPTVLTAQTPFDKVLGCSNIAELKYEWIWEKGNATGHLNAKKAPMKAHENILVFCRAMPVYNPQKTHGHIRKVSTKRIFKSPVYGQQNIDSDHYDSTERYPRSVLQFSSDKQKSKLHPTQKPVALMEYLIKTYTNIGDTVLDFCMGSGTTGVACANTERKFIGIEKDEKYFQIAHNRITKESDNERE